jgi:hypothetical protein
MSQPDAHASLCGGGPLARPAAAAGAWVRRRGGPALAQPSLAPTRQAAQVRSRHRSQWPWNSVKHVCNERIPHEPPSESRCDVRPFVRKSGFMPAGSGVPHVTDTAGTVAVSGKTHWSRRPGARFHPQVLEPRGPNNRNNKQTFILRAAHTSTPRWLCARDSNSRGATSSST